MRSTILERNTDDAFFVRALAEYTESANDKYQRVLQCLQTVIDSTGADTGSNQADTGGDEWVSPITVDQINEICANLGFSPDCFINVGSGYMKLSVLAYDISMATASSMNEGDSFGAYTVTAIQATESPISLTLDEVFTGMKSSLHASVVLGAACKAKIEAAVGSVADAIAIFNDRIRTIFQDEYDDISNSANYYKQLLSPEVDITQFMLQLQKDSGVDNYADDTWTGYDRSNISQYTGASPYAALDIQGASRVAAGAANVIKAGASAIAGMFRTGVSLLGGLFKKVKKALVNATVYPIEVLNDKASSYTVDGFFSSEFTPITVQAVGDLVTTQDLTNFLLRNPDHWFKFEFWMGEVLLREVNGSVEWRFKPRCVNYRVVQSMIGSPQEFNVAHSGYEWSAAYASRILDQIRSSPNIYQDAMESTTDAYLGFFYAYWCFRTMVIAANAEMVSNTLEAVSTYPVVAYTIADPAGRLASLANIDIVRICSGYVAGTPDRWDVIPYDIISMYESNSRCDVIGETVKLLSNQLFTVLTYRDKHPLDDTFMPYSNNKTAWLEARYSVKTDNEIQESVTKFLTVATAIIIVAAVAATAIVAVKRIAKKAFWKHKYRAEALQKKIYNGTPLTNREKRQFLRSQKKLSASSMATSGLQNSPMAVNQTITDSSAVSAADVYSLIKA